MTGVDQERFFFAHVQKASGTSLIARLERQFSPAEIYPNDSDAETGAPLPRLAPTLLVSRLRDRYRVRRDEIRVVTGHFPVRTAELLGDPFTTLTLVREPVERTLSALRHHQVKVPADRERTLEELYDDPVRFDGLIHNHMVKMFSLTPEEIVAADGIVAHVEEFTADRVEDAKTRLAAVDVLGLHDHLDEFCTELTQRFGWRLGGSVHGNRTEPFEVAQSFRDRIARENAPDCELYEYAVELHAQRAPSARRGA